MSVIYWPNELNIKFFVCISTDYSANAKNERRVFENQERKRPLFKFILWIKNNTF